MGVKMIPKLLKKRRSKLKGCGENEYSMFAEAISAEETWDTDLYDDTTTSMSSVNEIRDEKEARDEEIFPALRKYSKTLEGSAMFSFAQMSSTIAANLTAEEFGSQSNGLYRPGSSHYESQIVHPVLCKRDIFVDRDDPSKKYGNRTKGKKKHAWKGSKALNHENQPCIEVVEIPTMEVNEKVIESRNPEEVKRGHLNRRGERLEVKIPNFSDEKRESGFDLQLARIGNIEEELQPSSLASINHNEPRHIHTHTSVHSNQYVENYPPPPSYSISGSMLCRNEKKLKDETQRIQTTTPIVATNPQRLHRIPTEHHHGRIARDLGRPPRFGGGIVGGVETPSLSTVSSLTNQDLLVSQTNVHDSEDDVQDDDYILTRGGYVSSPEVEGSEI